MEKLDNCNELDKLYADLCDSLRKTGKASSFCQLIKSATSDLSRIVILNNDCNIVASLIKTLKKCRKNNCKISQQAYYSKKTEAVNEGGKSLIHLLNSALSHLQVDDDKIAIEQFNNFGDCEINFVENFLVDCNDIDDSNENLLLSEIYSERASYFNDVGEHKMTIIESLRAMRYAKFNKNDPSERWFLFLFRISTSLVNLNQLQAATNVLEFSIKLLRSSSLDNVVKSVETMKMVKLLKNIQINTKDGIGNRDIPLNLSSSLEPTSEILPKIFCSISDPSACTSSSLQMKWQEDRGRHMIATKTIPPGSTLIVEHPYSWIIHPSHSPSYCQNCCREVKNLIPCHDCSSAVFCSERCHRASESYHRFECDFLKMLTSSDILGDMALLCYRTVSKNDFRLLLSHIQEYYQFVDDGNNSQTNEQSFHDKFLLGLNEHSKLDSADYCSVFAQTANTNVRQGGDLLKRSFSAICLTLCLRLTGYFKNCNEENDSESRLTETEELIASLFLRHLQSTSCNAYSINQVTNGNDPRRLEVNEIGGATYPIISTTNHSCASNVYRFSVGKICIVKALREIQCGEEILDSYGPHFACNSIEERNRLLKGQYLFTCDCLACTETWLSYSKLPKENPCITCTTCGNELRTKKKDKFVCSECGNALDAKKFKKMVIECEQHYQDAKKLLLNANKDPKINYENIEDSIVAYANILGMTQKWPCQVLIECEETLKLCWNLQNSI